MAGEWWSAGKDSPCSGCLRLDRDIFLPARARWAEMGGFSCAGRVLYRLWPYTPCAGRVLYRLALRSGLLGEFCTGCGHACRVLGEFCTGCGHACRVLGEFCTGACALRGWWVVVCGRKFALQGVRALQTRNFSPSVPKIGQNERFLPCWASFSRCVPGRGFAGRAVSRDKPATQPDAPGSKLVPATPVRKARGNQAVTPAPASSLTPGR